MARVHIHRGPAGEYLCTDDDCTRRLPPIWWRFAGMLIAAALGFVAARSIIGCIIVAVITLAAVPILYEVRSRTKPGSR